MSARTLLIHSRRGYSRVARTRGPLPADQEQIISSVLADVSAPARLEIEISSSDPVLLAALELLKTYSGVILTGPPGTSKSYYARQIAATIADGDPGRVRFVQFHPSYQYEDFVEGYVPRQDGKGYELKPKHLVEMARLAGESHKQHVIVIDELSRGDPARVFGEALTYVEKTKRRLTFSLASGTEMAIPEELIFLATTNPLDRGVDEVDAAFDRRFAKIAMNPESAQLLTFLERNGMDAVLRDRVAQFFIETVRLGEKNPYARIGHAYFNNVATREDLESLWEHQLQFVFEKAFRHSRPELEAVTRAWARVVRQPAASEPANSAPGATPPPAATEAT